MSTKDAGSYFGINGYLSQNRAYWLMMDLWKEKQIEEDAEYAGMFFDQGNDWA